MFIATEQKRTGIMYRISSCLIAFTFVFSMVCPAPLAAAKPATVLGLPEVGQMLKVSEVYTPTLMQGMTLHPENPLEFDFIIEVGDDEMDDEALKVETKKLVKYFLATLTIPEEELWVNLTPHEKDKIIPQSFGRTEMGRDLLVQDYLLKQLTASLIYPEDELGKKFWDKVYKRAYELYGTTEIPVNTFNRVWIIPGEATVYQNGPNILILENRLKVMLEEDYLGLQKGIKEAENGLDELSKDDAQVITTVTSDVVREVLIPELEREINQGKTFMTLRQIFNSMLLATWYKENLRETVLGVIYVDKNKTSGVEVKDKTIKEKIYKQYLEALEIGVFDYVRQDYDPATQKTIPRTYYSGGVVAKREGPVLTATSKTRQTPRVRRLAEARMREAENRRTVRAHVGLMPDAADAARAREPQQAENWDMFARGVEQENIAAAQGMKWTPARTLGQDEAANRDMTEMARITRTAYQDMGGVLDAMKNGGFRGADRMRQALDGLVQGSLPDFQSKYQDQASSPTITLVDVKQDALNQMKATGFSPESHASDGGITVVVPYNASGQVDRTELTRRIVSELARFVGREAPESVAMGVAATHVMSSVIKGDSQALARMDMGSLNTPQNQARFQQEMTRKGFDQAKAGEFMPTLQRADQRIASQPAERRSDLLTNDIGQIGGQEIRFEKRAGITEQRAKEVMEAITPFVTSTQRNRIREIQVATSDMRLSGTQPAIVRGKTGDILIVSPQIVSGQVPSTSITPPFVTTRAEIKMRTQVADATRARESAAAQDIVVPARLKIAMVEGQRIAHDIAISTNQVKAIMSRMPQGQRQGITRVRVAPEGVKLAAPIVRTGPTLTIQADMAQTGQLPDTIFAPEVRSNEIVDQGTRAREAVMSIPEHRVVEAFRGQVDQSTVRRELQAVHAAAAGSSAVIRNPGEFRDKAPRLAEVLEKSPQVAQAIIDSAGERTGMADAARAREISTTESMRHAPSIEVGRVDDRDVAFIGISPDQGARIMERIPLDQRRNIKAILLAPPGISLTGPAATAGGDRLVVRADLGRDGAQLPAQISPQPISADQISNQQKAAMEVAARAPKEKMMAALRGAAVDAPTMEKIDTQLTNLRVRAHPGATVDAADFRESAPDLSRALQNPRVARAVIDAGVRDIVAPQPIDIVTMSDGQNIVIPQGEISPARAADIVGRISDRGEITNVRVAPQGVDVSRPFTKVNDTLVVSRDMAREGEELPLQILPEEMAPERIFIPRARARVVAMKTSIPDLKKAFRGGVLNTRQMGILEQRLPDLQRQALRQPWILESSAAFRKAAGQQGAELVDILEMPDVARALVDFDSARKAAPVSREMGPVENMRITTHRGKPIVHDEAIRPQRVGELLDKLSPQRRADVTSIRKTTLVKQPTLVEDESFMIPDQMATSEAPLPETLEVRRMSVGQFQREAAKAIEINPAEVGGIDLNPALFELQIRRDENGMPLPIMQQPILNTSVDGFVPVILDMAPISNYNALIE